MRYLLTLLVLSIGLSSMAQENSVGDVVGSVIDIESREYLYSAVVCLAAPGVKYLARTDFDGNFRINDVPIGLYSMHIRLYGDTLKDIQVEIIPDGITFLGEIEFRSTLNFIGCPTMPGYFYGLASETLPVKLISTELETVPITRHVSYLVPEYTTDVRTFSTGEIIVRGSREGDVLYLIDGVKTPNQSAIPLASIDEVRIYTNGIPAKYGDTMGGVVSIRTKSYFDLVRERESRHSGYVYRSW